MADNAEAIAREQTNSVVEVVPGAHRFSILSRADGQFLSSTAAGLAFVGHVNDSCVWDASSDGFTHPLTGAAVETDEKIEGAGFVAEWGPESLPSEYLASLIQDGHVCMPALLAPELCHELQQLANAPSKGEPMVLRAAAGIKVSTHPVAMWVIRSYLQVDYKLAHSPGFAILPAVR